ncbi:hypothetical protein [Burkholderia glumae]|nr:hypothetical protein [Burkholderia glumae]
MGDCVRCFRGLLHLATTHYAKGDAARKYQTVDAFFNAALE